MFGEVYGRQITGALVNIWVKQLKGVSTDRIAALFQRHMKTSRYFPTPADILNPEQEVKKLEIAQSAELAWQKVLQYVRDWVHPDIEFSKKPQLPTRMDRAARAAGGLIWLRECSTEDLQWAKKRFIEAYERFEELNQEQYLIQDPEIKQLFTEAAERLDHNRPDYLQLPSNCESAEWKKEFSDVSDRLLPERVEISKQQKKVLNVKESTLTIEEQKTILRQKGFLQ